MAMSDDKTRNDGARTGAGISGDGIRAFRESGIALHASTRRQGIGLRSASRLEMHRAPIPGEDEPLPGEGPAPDPHPVPDDDPVPDRDPVVRRPYLFEAQR